MTLALATLSSELAERAAALAESDRSLSDWLRARAADVARLEVEVAQLRAALMNCPECVP